MAIRLGIDGASARVTSDRADEIRLTLDLVITIANKIRRSTLSFFDRQTPGLTTVLKLPITPDRVQELIKDSTQEHGELVSNKERLETVAKWVRENFRYEKSVCSRELSKTSVSQSYSLCAFSIEEPRMITWLISTVGLTILAIELRRNTPFMTIPAGEQKNSCYRYALERVGMTVPLLKDTLSLKRFLLSNFEIVPKPEEGDLILFSKRAQLTHLGIQYQGKVLSKEGNIAIFAYVRPLEDLTPEYGENVTYLRKKSLVPKQSEASGVCKETSQNLYLEQGIMAGREGTSENQHSGAKSTSLKTNS